MGEKDIILSIAIPTYNRASIVRDNVKNMLECLGNTKEVEIVVSDNASEDETFALLKGIQDERLKLYQNTTNLGFTKNLYNVIQKSRGKFVMILSDEDSIYFEMLDDLIECLKQNQNIGGFVGNYYAEGSIENKKQELLSILYGRCSYMSGLIYNKEKIEVTDYECMNTIYPHIFLMLKLGLRGTILFSGAPLYKHGEESSYNEVGDTAEYDETRSYVHPYHRMQQMKDELSIIGTLAVDDDIKYALLLKVFGTKLTQGMIVYDLILRNSALKNQFRVQNSIDYVKYAQEMLELILIDITRLVGNKYVGQGKITGMNEIKYHLSVLNERKKVDQMIQEGYQLVVLTTSVDDMANLQRLEGYQYHIDGVIIDSQQADILKNDIVGLGYKVLEKNKDTLKKVVLLYDGTYDTATIQDYVDESTEGTFIAVWDILSGNVI